REIDRRWRLISQTVVTHVADNSDDLCRLWSFKHRNVEALSDRIFIREMFASQRVVDQYDVFCVFQFEVGKVATTQQRNPHCWKVTGIDNANIPSRSLAQRRLGTP